MLVTWPTLSCSFSMLIHTSSTSSQHIAIPPTCLFILSLPCRTLGLTQSSQQVHGCGVTHWFMRNCWKQDLSFSIPQLLIGFQREVRLLSPFSIRDWALKVSVLKRPCASSYSYYEFMSTTAMSCLGDSVLPSVIHHPTLILSVSFSGMFFEA